MDTICNSAYINGVIVSPYYLAYVTEDGQCYKVFVKTMRLSRTEDTVPVIVPEICLKDTMDDTGRTVSVTGTFQSRNRHADGKNHLDLFLYADSFVFGDGEGDVAMEGAVKDTVKDNNQVILEGFLCRTPVYRKTSLGRKITNLLVAVNAPDPKRPNYIPCIAWGRDAIMAGGMHTGDCVRQDASRAGNTSSAYRGRMGKRSTGWSLTRSLASRYSYALTDHQANPVDCIPER